MQNVITDDELTRAVAVSYAHRPGADRSWPPPRGALESPRDEEYSRVTDPERYRIVAARARAWEHVLTGLGLAAVEPTGRPDWAQADSRATVLRPREPRAAPLVVSLEAIDGVAGTSVALGVGQPPTLLGRQPDCGCDACDWGSDDLLEAVDSLYLSVVARDFVHVEGTGWSVSTTEDGWAVSGEVSSPEAVIARARRGERVGRSRIVAKAWS